MREPLLSWLELMPAPIPRILPDLWFRFPASEPRIYLTFDDGPHPEHTPALLNLLDQHNARATFFMVGSQAQKHPKLVQRVARNHSIANHTWNHLRLRGQSYDVIASQLERTRVLLEELSQSVTEFFRPPYGVLGRTLLRYARQQGHQIVMWDVLPWDFLSHRTADHIIACLINKVRPGSIVVLHDGHKCAPKMIAALRVALPVLKARGFAFDPLPHRESRAALSGLTNHAPGRILPENWNT